MDFVLAGIWMSLAWSLRGQFGHLKGALIPGAFAALFLSQMAGDEKWRRTLPQAALLGSLGFCLGGHMAYGKIVEGIVRSPDLISAAPLFGKIFLIGSVWGGLGATLLGFGFSEKKLTGSDFLFLAALFLFWFVLLGILNLEEMDLPAFGAGLALLQTYNLLYKKSRIIGRLGLAGFLGFGTGFLLSVFILRAGGHGFFGWAWPWWRLRDQILGGIGGIFLYAGARNFSRQGISPADAIHDSIRRPGFLWLLVLIPVLNITGVLKDGSTSPRFPALGIYFVTAHLAFFFLILAAGILKIKAEELAAPRVFTFSAIYLIWFLSFGAIAKETVLFGWTRWETAHSLFLIFSAFLSFSLFRLRSVS